MNQTEYDSMCDCGLVMRQMRKHDEKRYEAWVRASWKNHYYGKKRPVLAPTKEDLYQWLMPLKVEDSAIDLDLEDMMKCREAEKIMLRTWMLLVHNKAWKEEEWVTAHSVATANGNS